VEIAGQARNDAARAAYPMPL